MSAAEPIPVLDPGPAAEIGRYPIGEVVERTGLSAHTLRWYERIGLLPQVGRESPRSGYRTAGRRLYSDNDLAFLDFVGKLRSTGMPVADMIRYAELAREGAGTVDERRDVLVAHRADVRDRIAELTACLHALDYKIDLYTRLRDDAADDGMADDDANHHAGH